MNYPSGKKIKLSNDDELIQRFDVSDYSIKSVKLFFSNPKGSFSKGSISVSVIDSNNKKVCDASLKASLINNNKRTTFDFVNDSESVNANRIVQKKYSLYKKEGIELNENKKYFLKIKCHDISPKDDFSVYTCNDYTKCKWNASFNGKETNKSIFCSIIFLHMNKAVFVIFIIGFLIGILCILLPINFISQKLSERRKKETDLNKILSRLLFVLTPFAALFINLKSFGFKATSMFTYIEFFPLLLNIVILVMILLLLYIIFNRIKYATVFTMIIAFIYALTNFLLIQFRNSPLVATDFVSVGTAMDVAANYTIIFSKSILWVITVSSIYVCLAISLKSYKSLELKKRIALLLVYFIAIGGCYYILFSKNAPANKIKISGFDAKRSYKKYGSILSFVLTIRSSAIKKPEGYSLEKVKKIISDYKSDSADKTTKLSDKKPNIIVIMNEAYSDLSYVGPFKTSGPYMPYFNSLKENTIKGKLHTSIFGGSTANTEYEFLTGNTLAFMPMYIVAYNSKVQTPSPSFARSLLNQGYGGNIAFHPGMRNSYNRDVVYPNLGFEKHIALEDLNNPEKVRSYVSDDYDYKRIISEYEKYRKRNNDPFWLFNVTIQNHSDFKLTSGPVEKQIVITDTDAKAEQAEQYLNLIKLSDEALQNLVEFFRSKDEPTVIVMFGDHQPRVEDEFYDILQSRTDNDSYLERHESLYQVPFMIWANFDIKEEKDVDISANYLGSYMFDKLKMPMTGYDKYLMDLYEEIPVITSVCYYDKDKGIHDYDKKTKYSKKLLDYQCLQYYNVVDNDYKEKDFFTLKH